MKANIVSNYREESFDVKKYFTIDIIARYIWPLLQAHWYLRRATHLGKKVRVFGRPIIENRGILLIGDRVRIRSTVAQTELVVEGGTLEVCDGAYINYGCSIAAQKLVRIGANCRIGTYVMITDNNFHRLEPERRDEIPESLPVIIEENVWLGGRVIVLPGVTIGAGSAVGAGSVVTRDIPPRSLAVGVPAKVIKELEQF
jgi:maltose O-acetyltransferase